MEQQAMEDDALTEVNDKNTDAVSSADQTPSTEPLFSEKSILAAVSGSLVFTVWVVATTFLLSFSPFSITRAHEVEPREFLARICITFALYGLIVGFVFYHLWQSIHRKTILPWMLKLGGAGAVLGATLGAVLPVSQSDLIGSNARIMSVIQGLASLAVISASLAALFKSSKRRAIIKSLFLPIALGIALRVLLLTFAPLEHMYVHNPFGRDYEAPPWLILNYIDSPSGSNAGIVLLVGLVLAAIRRVKFQKRIA